MQHTMLHQRHERLCISLTVDTLQSMFADKASFLMTIQEQLLCVCMGVI